MRFFIAALIFSSIERSCLKISRLLARIFSDKMKLLGLKQLPTASIGDIDTGQALIKELNLFGNVFLDVKTKNPWRILPFSEEVEVGIDGFSWLNDLAIVNNQTARELSKEWIDIFPLNRLNKNVQSSCSRLSAIVRNYLYLEIFSDKEQMDNLRKILKNDYFFVSFYKNFSFNILERLSICHSLVLCGYAFNYSKKKQKKIIRNMISLLSLYKNRVKKGQVRNPEELSKIFFYLLETIEIETNIESYNTSIEEEKLRKMSYFFGSSLRSLLFGDGSLVSAQIASDWEVLREAKEEVLVNSLSMLCPFEPEEKQVLLEAETIVKRLDVLMTLMKLSSDNDLESQYVQ